MKKFLTAFTGIAAAFASNAIPAPATTYSTAPTIDAQNVSAPQKTTLGENIITTNEKGDQFGFVLKRSAQTDLMMAAHASHASHASHTSSR